MSVVLLVLYIAVSIFILLMWIRFVLDLVVSLARAWRPHGVALVLSEFTYTVTDPPVKLVRKVVPALRIGGLVFDLSWGIVLVAALIVSYVISLSAGFTI